MASLAYKVEDRSLLLPAYKRLLIEPLVAKIPARVHPNAITHAGHLFNLGAMLAVLLGRGAAAYVSAALLVQLYNFCDNADGAHARRTNQCSALGELLDHGLDMLNAGYIAVVTAASVNAPAAWTVAIGVVVPAAAAATCWEQAETGVFHLGRLNQVEALTMLSAVLVVSAIFGADVWARLAIGPITVQLALLAWTVAQTCVGMVRGLARVARAKGVARLAPALPLVAFNAAILGAKAAGAASPAACVVMAIAANAAFGLRMLAVRIAGRRPALSSRFVAGTFGVAGLVVWRLEGKPMSATLDIGFAAAIAIVFAALAWASTADAARRVAVLDRRG